MPLPDNAYDTHDKTNSNEDVNNDENLNHDGEDENLDENLNDDGSPKNDNPEDNINGIKDLDSQMNKSSSYLK